ncbi:MAG: hypothetical protein OJF49_003542 [Ktedonobacterales bacterium]|nr:MAG: hypothetical protein OJF49_003542 [Ktedonobacterales bacterium]
MNVWVMMWVFFLGFWWWADYAGGVIRMLPEATSSRQDIAGRLEGGAAGR